MFCLLLLHRGYVRIILCKASLADMSAEEDKKSRRALMWGKNWVISYVATPTLLLCLLCAVFTSVMEVESFETQERILGPLSSTCSSTLEAYARVCFKDLPRLKKSTFVIQ